MDYIIVVICLLIYAIIGGIIYGLLKDSKCGDKVDAAMIATSWVVVLLGLPIIAFTLLGIWVGKKLKELVEALKR